MDIEIKYLIPTHMLCIVTTRKGYSYACTWAIERDEKGEIISPTIEQVEEAWRNNRQSFSKYNGVYLFNDI
ncbi:DUF4028 domain-containing protein [Butyricicoccus sp. 1XD8-22]|nr:DUF4028 domain-containing protein [Butyricicoccus sp. 1XD8-22]